MVDQRGPVASLVTDRFEMRIHRFPWKCEDREHPVRATLNTDPARPLGDPHFSLSLRLYVGPPFVLQWDSVLSYAFGQASDLVRKERSKLIQVLGA